MGSFWENIRTWCQYRDLSNMHLFHYNNLKRDLPGELRELAGFLDIPIDEARWLQIVESCTFDWMRADAEKVAPMGGVKFKDGGKTFIHKATNNRCKDGLTEANYQECLDLAEKELGAQCAAWVVNGGPI